ncbi:hypothetical protein [Parahalioglobus pacificus]|uniref:General secretion pathway protein K n=1 Tax=Parahalioglobus pacificus TaxID=930806 RepID=A0A918XMK6_9GAMM|nr:hypothetical protein [Halioglobus pacificus]GHD37932.1 hypothetical protein GCM10007053_27630 [Halioglobus pacificus]
MRSQQGVALAIVVWFIAGMSLLVAGIVAQARVDTQLAQVHADRARVIAAGDGAVRLLIADIVSESRQRNLQEPPQLERRYRVGEQEVTIVITPVQGLISLNDAQVPLLRELFKQAAGMEQGEAVALARTVNEWRNSRPRPRAAINTFEVGEDLLRVGGFSRGDFDQVRDYVVAGRMAGERTVPMIASPEVRQILAASGVPVGNPSQAAIRQILAGSPLRVDAIIKTGGREWVRRQWLQEGNSGVTDLPWHAMRIEPPRVMRGKRRKTDG